MIFELLGIKRDYQLEQEYKTALQDFYQVHEETRVVLRKLDVAIREKAAATKEMGEALKLVKSRGIQPPR